MNIKRVMLACLLFFLTMHFRADANAAGTLRLLASEKAITVTQDGKQVVCYNKISPPAPRGIDPTYRRSGCLHPVSSPNGRVVTAMFPFDHPHQHGVFTAWVRTTYGGRPVDFWNLAGDTGRVLHERVVSTFHNRDRAGFEVDLVHRALGPPSVDVLRERWKITVISTDGSYHLFDLETTQRNITDKPLHINEYHYGGFALRGPTRWLTRDDRETNKTGTENEERSIREPSSFLNDLGSDRFDGNHQRAKWVALSGRIDGDPVTIAVLSHADNFRAPQAARLHPTKPYFCFAPCVDGAFTIDRDHPYEARYRFVVSDGEPDAERISRLWRQWCGL